MSSRILCQRGPYSMWYTFPHILFLINIFNNYKYIIMRLNTRFDNFLRFNGLLLWPYVSSINPISTLDPCPAGTYKDSSMTECQQCPTNTYSEERLGFCRTCPHGSLANKANTQCGKLLLSFHSFQVIDNCMETIGIFQKMYGSPWSRGPRS